MKIGFFCILQIGLILLKVANVLTWSWWLVCLPFFIWLLGWLLVVTTTVYTKP